MDSLISIRSRLSSVLIWLQSQIRARRERGRGAALSGFMTIAVVMMLGKVVSFVKDACVARHFGISDALDTFILAFSLLSFLACMIGGGMPEAFIPGFAQVSHRRSIDAAHRLGMQLAVVNASVLSAVSLFIYLAAPLVIDTTARGFDDNKRQLAVSTLGALIPFFLCYGLTFHFAAWLRAQKRFAPASASPIILPAVIIIGLLASGSGASIDTLIWATDLGAALQLNLLLIAVLRTVSPTADCFRNVLTRWVPGTRRVLHKTLPFALSGLVMGSSVFVDQAMASWLEPGSVTILNYSDKVCGILLALTAVPAAEALFPFFADSAAKRDWIGLKQQLVRVTGAILVLAVPMTLVLCWLAPLVVKVLFERGEFHASDTVAVAHVLRFAALQVPFYIAGSLASRIAVSMQATKFIMALSIGTVVVNFLMDALLMQFMGVAGIALSTVLVHVTSAVAVFTFVLRRTSALHASGKTQEGGLTA
jgi:putative peptidoglycan lipid II flippase